MVAISLFRESSQFRDQTQASYVCQTLYLLSHRGSPYIIYGGGLVTKSCPTLCDPTDCGHLPDSSVHGIFQTRILEWVAISFSRGSSPPRDWIWVSCIAGRFFTNWATKEAPYYIYTDINTTHRYNFMAALKKWINVIYWNIFIYLKIHFFLLILHDSKTFWWAPRVSGPEPLCLLRLRESLAGGFQ